MNNTGFENVNVILGVTGSIAAYKAAELVREFIKRGAIINVVMTKNACEFVTPLTFQTLSKNPVTLSLFNQINDWKPEHISLAERSDIFVIAPATANVIAKYAGGIADDALTSELLAFNKKVVIAPAMNSAMYLHPATQENIEKLKSRGVVFVEPEEGELACGTSGIGRMPSISKIIEKCNLKICVN